MSDANAQLQDLYRSGNAVRTSGLDQPQAEKHYFQYLEFVKKYQPSGKLLDVGCGVGWSTAVFAHSGYDATGIDLNPDAFEPPARDGLTLGFGSALDIPFADGTFDVVSSYQVIEHVPDPKQMLAEMLRVVRPNGIVCIVGPNLLALGGSATSLVRYVWKNRPFTSIIFRTRDMPRHPFGNTLPEAFSQLIRNAITICSKQFRTDATFTMREPDLRPPFHADNDASYLCNPIDLVQFFRRRHCRVLQDVRPGRSRLTRMLATGTWVAVRKGEQIG